MLATPGGERLYTQALAARGIDTVLLEGADREAFMALVYGVKRGDVGPIRTAGITPGPTQNPGGEETLPTDPQPGSSDKEPA